MIPKLTLVTIGILIGYILTLVKRVRRQDKQIRYLINQGYEQKSKKAKSKESEAEKRQNHDNTGGTTERSPAN